MLRWSNGIARREMKLCTSSNAASASRFGLLRDEMVFFRALVEQTCLGAPEQHKREPRRPKPVPYTRIPRLRHPGNFWRFLAIFWCFFRPNTIPDKNGEDPRRGSGQECPKGRFSVSGLCVYCQGSCNGVKEDRRHPGSQKSSSGLPWPRNSFGPTPIVLRYTPCLT